MQTNPQQLFKKPFLLLTVGLAITLIVTLLMGWNIYWENLKSKRQLYQQITVEKLYTRLLGHNDLLQSYITLAVHDTKNVNKYEQKYLAEQKKLKIVFKQIKQFTLQYQMPSSYSSITASRAMLTSTELHSFKLLQQHKDQDAEQLLQTLLYQDENKRYQRAALQLVALSNPQQYWLELSNSIRLNIQRQNNALLSSIVSQDKHFLRQYIQLQQTVANKFHELQIIDSEYELSLVFSGLQRHWQAYNKLNNKIVLQIENHHYTQAKTLFYTTSHRDAHQRLRQQINKSFQFINKGITQQLKHYDWDIILSVLIIILVIALLGFIWLHIIKSFKYWRQELYTSYRQLMQLNRELDKKVMLRTEKLQLAYEQLQQETEEKQNLLAALQESQKLQAIGTLAAGIAHDFNNLLAVILAHSEFLHNKLQDETTLNALEQIIDTTNKASHLTQQLLTFGRKTHHQASKVDINSLVHEVEDLLAPNLPTKIKVHLQLDDDTWPINADMTQALQVLLNLGLNARDACHDEGKITFHSHNAQLDATDTERHPDLKPGDYVIITVTDNGQGMSLEQQQRIFEPFFTTKEVGQGTGLGLAVAYGIMQQHHGLITAESQMGKGTCFTLYFPRYRD
jgi:signal transduction histidine kinase